MTPSAFDIAGAVVATPLAIAVLAAFSYGIMHEPEETKAILLCLSVGLTCAIWAAFCIARLFGASL